MAGPQAALCCALRRTHSFRQQTEEVKVNVGLTTSDPEQNERSNVLQSERLKVKRRSSSVSPSHPVSSLQQAEGAVVEPALPRSYLHQGL